MAKRPLWLFGRERDGVRHWRLVRLRPGVSPEQIRDKYPDAVLERLREGVPSLEEVEEMLADGEVYTPICHCSVEPDGVCPHGRPSWLLVLGYM